MYEHDPIDWSPLRRIAAHTYIHSHSYGFDDHMCKPFFCNILFFKRKLCVYVYVPYKKDLSLDSIVCFFMVLLLLPFVCPIRFFYIVCLLLLFSHGRFFYTHISYIKCDPNPDFLCVPICALEMVAFEHKRIFNVTHRSIVRIIFGFHAIWCIWKIYGLQKGNFVFFLQRAILDR